jgi:hypothetical protein
VNFDHVALLLLLFYFNVFLLILIFEPVTYPLAEKEHFFSRSQFQEENVVHILRVRQTTFDLQKDQNNREEISEH